MSHRMRSGYYYQNFCRYLTYYRVSKLDDEYMRYVSDEKEENRSKKKMSEEEQKNIERVIEALRPNCPQQRPIPRPENVAGPNEERADKKD